MDINLLAKTMKQAAEFAEQTELKNVSWSVKTNDFTVTMNVVSKTPIGNNLE